MILQQVGHAEFMIELADGMRIVTDPYDEGCGYPVRKVRADAALVSHGHHDHNATQYIEGLKTIVNQAGEYTLAPGIRVTALKSYHDDARGSKRGETLLFLLEAEGLRIVHMGDLGCMPDEEQIRILTEPDVLMIPVGGFYTIDGDTARNLAKQLNARVICPMHYKTIYNADWPISDPSQFLKGFTKDEIRKDIEALRITKEDRDCQPRVVLFKA